MSSPSRVKVPELYLIMIRCGVDRRITRKKCDVFSTCSISVFLSKWNEEKKTSIRETKKISLSITQQFSFSFSLIYWLCFVFAHGAVDCNSFSAATMCASSFCFQLKPFSSSRIHLDRINGVKFFCEAISNLMWSNVSKTLWFRFK